MIRKIAMRHIRSEVARRFPIVTALECAGVPDSFARGLYYGTVAAGIGTGHSSVESQTQRTAAGVAMGASIVVIRISASPPGARLVEMLLRNEPP